MMIQCPPIVDEPPPPSITGAPHFAAAIDLPSPPFSPAVPAPYQAAPPPPSPQVEVPAEEAGIEVVAAGRRKVLVLGGVAVLGVVIFLLAAMRLARREPDVRPAAVSPPAPTVSAAQIPSPAMSAGPPPASAPASAPSSASTRVAMTPPAQITTLHAPPVAAKPTPVAAAATPRTLPAAQNPAAAKPRPKPTFDPNSL